VLYLWLTAGLVLALDQYTKHFVTVSFMPGESRIAVPHLLYWTYVQNHAGAFGLFGTKPWLLVGMALAVLGLFWYAFRDVATKSKLVSVAFGAIAGGAIGNIVDRFHYAYVVDFIDLRWWPVFNVADSCITIGVGLLVLSSILRERRVAQDGTA
jgi:signal peptidase II